MRIASASILSLFVSLTSAKVFFEERFHKGNELESRWTVPKAPLKNKEGQEIPLGTWTISKEALKTLEDSRFYEITSKLDVPFTNKDNDLIVQLTVQHPQQIDCGGGYVKLLGGKDLNQDSFSGESPYLLMFGPDICGSSRKVHVIWNYKGSNYLIKKEIPAPHDMLIHLYTLIVKADQTYEVLIDNNKVAFGSLLEDWDFLPPRKIKDLNAKKPEDWVDIKEIDDSEDKKPEDWDNEPEFLTDLEAEKPADWDEQMDGEWKAPQKPNPAYKGEWKPRKIKNPDYQGPWVAPMIDNPDYIEDDSIYALKDISAVGFDLWQVKSGSLFDNILITDDIEYAKKVADEEWEPIYKKEKEESEEEMRKLREQFEKEQAAREEAEAKKKANDEGQLNEESSPLKDQEESTPPVSTMEAAAEDADGEEAGEGEGEGEENREEL